MKKLALAFLCLVLPFGRMLMADQLLENNTDHDITYTLSWTDDWSYDHWDYDHGWTDTGQDSGSDVITLGAGQSVYIISQVEADQPGAAAAVSVLLLVTSLAVLTAFDLLRRRLSRHDELA